MDAEGQIFLVVFIVIAALIGGAVYWLYSTMRKDREKKWSEFASSHGLVGRDCAKEHAATMTGVYRSISVEISREKQHSGNTYSTYTRVTAFPKYPTCSSSRVLQEVLTDSRAQATVTSFLADQHPKLQPKVTDDVVTCAFWDPILEIETLESTLETVSNVATDLMEAALRVPAFQNEE